MSPYLVNNAIKTYLHDDEDDDDDGDDGDDDDDRYSCVPQNCEAYIEFV
jgi:hypothetical protein